MTVCGWKPDISMWPHITNSVRAQKKEERNETKWAWGWMWWRARVGQRSIRHSYTICNWSERLGRPQFSANHIQFVSDSFFSTFDVVSNAFFPDVIDVSVWLLSMGADAYDFHGHFFARDAQLEIKFYWKNLQYLIQVYFSHTHRTIAHRNTADCRWPER